MLLPAKDGLMRRRRYTSRRSKELEYILILNIVNNLGTLYTDLGWLDKAEKIYQRAL